ncbi:MAG: HNH endonuclease [Bacteroidetes bacterium]|nr:HNH endonuclease [Bacteroidota bacterium]
MGCIVLSNPIFFDETDWIDIPSDWSLNIVQGKTYNNEDKIGNQLWNKIEEKIIKHKLFETQPESKSQLVLESKEADRYGKEILTRVRLGQSAFRVLITDAYTRRCSISGEKTLPVLEAAHIKPYEKSRPHFVSNGLLLRADIHKLFDKGYITITHKYNIEVSRRIKEEFENGRDYYKYHGKDLICLPKREIDKPRLEFIDWHNNNIYKG